MRRAHPTINFSKKAPKCTACIKGKMHSFSFKPQQDPRKFKSGEKLQWDLGGPFVRDRKGNKYQLLCIDEESDYTYCSYLRKKNETRDRITKIKANAERQSGNKVKVELADLGGEISQRSSSEMLNVRESNSNGLPLMLLNSWERWRRKIARLTHSRHQSCVTLMPQRDSGLMR